MISASFMQTASSDTSYEWIVELALSETNGANENIYFGEALDASDGQDSYDTPKPPTAMPPYIFAWFDASLVDPYDKLMRDIRKNPDTEKVWNLTVQWVPSDYASSTDITISWDISDLIDNGYDTCVLFDLDDLMVVADLLSVSNYTFSTSALMLNEFQIICNSTESTMNSPPNAPTSPKPNNGSIDVSISTMIDWVGDDPDLGDILSYDVYFGTSNNPQKVAANHQNSNYDPGELGYNTVYYWKIVAWDDKGNWAEGPIWHFRTGSQTQPPPPENTPPVADAGGPYMGYENQTIKFNASISYDTDGIIEYYRWDFESDSIWDTDLNNIATITHIYDAAGNYSVTLQVTDDKEATDTDTQTVTVFEIEDGVIPPVADAKGPYTGYVYQNITFDASASYDSDGNIVNYTWDFGDGTIKYGINPIHFYSLIGTFYVTLTVRDDSGLVGIYRTIAKVIQIDSDNDGWGDYEEEKFGTDPDNKDDFPTDSDNDHVPDSEDSDDDNDLVSDIIEKNLGSDPTNSSDVTLIEIDGISYFLINTDRDGYFDLFYNLASGKATDLGFSDNKQYLIDQDGDNRWDYAYDLAGGLTSYKEEDNKSFLDVSIIIYILIILVIIIVIGLVLKFKVFKKS
jgi:PKD repeat protein